MKRSEKRNYRHLRELNLTRRLSLLLAILALTACSLPFASQPTIQPAIADEVDDPARIAASHPAQRDQVALAKAFKKVGEIPTVARTTPSTSPRARPVCWPWSARLPS